MGEAKRRRGSTATAIATQTYTLNLYDAAHCPIVSIPMPIRARSKPLTTDTNATGMAGAIIYYLANPTDYFWQEMEAAIGRYCARLVAIPDLETIQEWAAVMPKSFWGNITRPDGVLVQYRDKDRGPLGDVVMESQLGVAPEAEGARSEARSHVSFTQMLRAN
ncbi:hypothetical protein H6F86_21120 [Phormidium sp. FACHB-592]|uniref:Uncharacterized protein n=1 Tax=Stenomitos frigidus AS-A4 TaxID=2933935 RepID=A0ABV0KEV3_9CYAN|nr:hypothetical protein [Phormidium sp. FACHB-592]MBD2076337.1 hypothetical protein [Phormidium sp. FACHB-592]